MFYKDQVIILKQSRFQESDLIIKALNPKGALICFIAKGALNSRKRFSGGVLEPAHYVGVEYKKPRNSALYFLCRAWFLKSFKGLRQDYDRLSLALYALSLVEKISWEGTEHNEDLFNLLGNTLQALEKTSHLSALQFIFEFRLLLSQGVLPKELQQYTALYTITADQHEKLKEVLPEFKELSHPVQTAIQQNL